MRPLFLKLCLGDEGVTKAWNDLSVHTVLSGNQAGWEILYYYSCDLTKNTYLAFPFVLMHEYVSHILTIDHGTFQPSMAIVSPSFLDGWMLYAIWHYLSKERTSKTLRRDLDINLWDDRLIFFQAQIFSIFAADDVVGMGSQNAHWFINQFKDSHFRKISQELLCTPSCLGKSKENYQQSPTNIHEQLMRAIFEMRTVTEHFPQGISQKNRKGFVIKNLKALRENSPESLTEWWNEFYRIIIQMKNY
jgi:cytochrome c-type biogenesis protein CcmH/NrfF